MLTDGETSGEQICRQLAQEAAARRSTSRSWASAPSGRPSLIKDLAKLSEGKWYYIDVNRRDEAERIFVEEFETWRPPASSTSRCTCGR